MEDDHALGERLGRAVRVIRTGQDVSRKELAKRSGLSYSYLAEIESGTKTPSSKALAALADALGMAAHELLEAAERWEHSPPPHSFDRLRDSFAGYGEPRDAGAAIAASMFASPRETRLGSASGRRRLLQNLQPLGVLTRGRRGEHNLEATLSALAESPGGAEAATELLELLAGLEPEDRERLLDLARRLGGE